MSEASPIVVPRDTVNDDFVVLVRWLLPDGSPVKPGVAVAEIETSKAVLELEADRDGFLVHGAKVLEQVAVGGEVGAIRATAAVMVSARQPAETAKPSAAPAQRVFSRRARELLAQRPIDEALLGDRVFVREQDVLAILEPASSLSAPVPPPATPAPRSGRGRATIAQSFPLTPAKRTEVRYLSSGTNTLLSAVTVHVRTAGLDVQIAARAAVRRMSYLDFVIAAAASRLRSYPDLNAFFADDQIHHYGEVNVGVAMNMGHGLMVPVIPGADAMAPEAISRVTADLAMRYLRRELAESDLVRGTFTVTDLSGAGASQVLPLVNRDQSAILAMGRAPGTLALTLSFDHRVTDGQQASQYLQELKDALEEGAPALESTTTPAPQAACGNCLVTLDRLQSFNLGGFLLPVVRPEGQGYICSTCLSGWNG